MTSRTVPRLQHPKFGACELIRVEATDWIVMVQSTGVTYRVTPELRSQFELIGDDRPTTMEVPSGQGNVTSRHVEPRKARSKTRKFRKIIESLRIGLPSLDGSTRQLAVGFQEMGGLINCFLRDVDTDGGGAMILKGEYGQGKTFTLTILEEIALEQGFLTVRTEIDATEKRLNKPHHIYRDLVRNMRLPHVDGAGIRHLAVQLNGFMEKKGLRSWQDRKQWLEEVSQCFPLAWLFSDPQFLHKPELVGLLECDPNYPASRARTHHVSPALPRQWPMFTASTQGDFASFLLSGLSRLARVLGYRGVIVLLDEMEKWHQLNWSEQTRAGNLLGGLIWGATAEEGQRGEYDHPSVLEHSGRCGGYPFTTQERSSVGVVVAMTPRIDDDPYDTWCEYGGPILAGEVPNLTNEQLIKYCKRVAPFFAEAYSLPQPSDDEIDEIAAEAISTWRRQDNRTTRHGVQSVISAFDKWRQQK